jgi:hypothetical protein
MADRHDKTSGDVVLRHYTDEAGKEGIETTGTISPGPDGRVYFTEDAYRRASDAQAKLALPRRPTGYFEVPVEAIANPSGPQRVLPDYGQPGGGTQVWITRRIDAEGSLWVALKQ